MVVNHNILDNYIETKEKEYMNFSEKLSIQRKTNNLSQEQLADAIGVTRQSVSKWESGESYPDMAKIIQLCKILNCSLNDIMDDGVMGEIKTEEVKKTNVLESFLKFITSLSNMFAHMKANSIIKMIIEMMVVSGLVALFGFVVYSLLEFAIYEFFGIFSGSIAYFIKRILVTLIELILILICVIVVFYIFKIRYLDYYITIEDQNALEQTEENPIEENKISTAINNNKREVVVIRDPKHSSSKFISLMGKLIKITFKCFVVLCVSPVIIGFLGAVISAVFALRQNGLIFKEAFVACLGAILVCVSIIYFVYNFIFDIRQKHSIILCIFLSGLLLTGIGVGLVANSLFKMEKTDSSILNVITTRIVRDEYDLKENDLLILNCFDVEFIEDESIDNVKLEFTISENSYLNTYEGSNSDGGINYYFYSNLDELDQIKLIFKDISNNTFRNDYNPGIIKVIIKGNSETLNKMTMEDGVIRIDG